MKPVIFFSHSSQDRDAILPIRDRLVEGCLGAVDVFMASDGASIPFGRNWLKEIEDALERCQLMFVWMTPASLGSRWIPFESGFAYSKGIRVVPVGFQGVRLGELPPPISILQGFDISSSQSLDNIVAIINEELSLTLPDLFDEEFYKVNVVNRALEDSPEILRFVRIIDCEFGSVSDGSGNIAHVKPQWHSIISESLSECGLPFAEREGEIRGAGFRVHNRPRGDKRPSILVNIDPLALNRTRHAWALARQNLYERERLPYTIYTPRLVEGVGLPDDVSLVGSRLMGSEVRFDTDFPHTLYGFRNIEFRIDVTSAPRSNSLEKEIALLVPRGDEDAIPLLSLLELLEARHILTT